MNQIMPQLLSSTRTYRTVWLVLLLVGALQAGYAASFIARSSSTVEGKIFFCLFDDAMISMRYADNWAQGHGLVWNPGERVEGYTNFGWTLMMGLLHLLHLSPSHTCLLVQILAIPILWFCMFATVRLAHACHLSPLAASCAVLLVGAYYNLIFWTVLGMETGLVTGLVTLALAGGVRSARQSEGSAWPMLWFAPAMLVRPDAIVFLLILLSHLLLFVRRNRGAVLAGFAVVVAVLTAHVLWRHSFYDEWLPNTYYLKATGWPLIQRLPGGILQSIKTLIYMGIPIALAIITMLIARRRGYSLLLLTFFGGVAYQTYVGGDAWPLDRFVIPGAIGLLVLAAEGISRITNLITRSSPGFSRGALYAALTLICVTTMNGRHLREMLLLDREHMFTFNLNSIRFMRAIDKIAEPQATVALKNAGIIPYFSRRQAFDIFGKCDEYIARLPAHENESAGHNKFDYEYTIGTYKPDIILPGQIADIPIFEVNYRPVAVKVDGIDVPLCVRKDSRRIQGGRPISWRQVQDMGYEMFFNDNPKFFKSDFNK